MHFYFFFKYKKNQKKNFIEAAECYLHLNEIIDKDLEKIDETDDDFDAKKKEREKKLIYIGKTIENFEKVLHFLGFL